MALLDEELLTKFQAAKELALESIQAADDGDYQAAWHAASMSNMCLLDILSTLAQINGFAHQTGGENEFVQ